MFYNPNWICQDCSFSPLAGGGGVAAGSGAAVVYVPARLAVLTRGHYPLAHTAASGAAAVTL